MWVAIKQAEGKTDLNRRACVYKGPDLCSGLLRHSSILSFRTFTELSLTFRFLTHLILIFVYNVRYGYNFIFPHIDNQLSQSCLLKNLSFSTDLLCQLHYIPSFNICLSLSWLSFYSTRLFVFISTHSTPSLIMGAV